MAWAEKGESFELADASPEIERGSDGLAQDVPRGFRRRR